MSLLEKQLIDTYVKRRLIEHAGYFIALLFFISLAILFVPAQLKEYIGTRSDVVKVQTANKALRARLVAFQEYPTQDLEDIVVVLNTLYPSQEDRFSIFAALDNLEGTTGIDIQTYSSPFSGKAFRDVSITVKARGSLTSFRSFLRDYVFRSGRFMTISNVTYSEEKQGINFTATFHSKNIELETDKAVEIRPDLIERAVAIKKEVESSGIVKREAAPEENKPENYSTKPNPFN